MHQAALYIILFCATAKGRSRAVRQEGTWFQSPQHVYGVAERIITLEEAGLRQLLALVIRTRGEAFTTDEPDS